MTVTFNQAAAAVDLRVLEYSGLDTASPLDVTAGAAGSGPLPADRLRPQQPTNSFLGRA